jgi:formate hydrogenlyase subunit 5
MRIVSAMCGSRFGRGVIVPGGIRSMPSVPPADLAAAVKTVHGRIRSDLRALENSASFLDRLRATGPLDADRAREHGALGPIGRASGFDDDDRRHRPYDGYPQLPPPEPPQFDAGDAMARARVRWHEIDTSVTLIAAALEAANELSSADPIRVRVEPTDGFAAGWAEAAQGEVLYGLQVDGDRVKRCFARSASFHNLLLFHDVFAGDIFTDLPFIEASFGLSYAGVAM